MTQLRFGPYTVELSRADKVLFPETGLTKRDLLDYYQVVADLILPHIRDRALTMHRFPEGIGEEGFYQQKAGDYFPEWIDRAELAKKDGSVEHVVCNNAATLAYLADQAVITPHPWLSRIDRPNLPDRLIFDLDPPDDSRPATVKDAALAVREVLGELGLPAYVKSTGSRGLHVMVPIRRDWDFDRVREFARDVARVVAARAPRRFTTEQRKNRRQGRLFLDTLRNAYGQTAVAPYAVRALPGGPVATPIDWDELESRRFDPRAWKLKQVSKAPDRLGTPWKGLSRRSRGLSSARKTLDELLGEVGQGG